MQTHKKIIPNPDAVICKSVLNAAKELNITQEQLGVIIGMQRLAITRMKQEKKLDITSKNAELAILFIRIYQALYALMGGDKEWMIHFLTTPNSVTRGIPLEQIKTVSGLITVLNFLEAMKGHI